MNLTVAINLALVELADSCDTSVWSSLRWDDCIGGTGVFCLPLHPLLRLCIDCVALDRWCCFEHWLGLHCSRYRVCIIASHFMLTHSGCCTSQGMCLHSRCVSVLLHQGARGRSTNHRTCQTRRVHDVRRTLRAPACIHAPCFETRRFCRSP